MIANLRRFTSVVLCLFISTITIAQNRIVGLVLSDKTGNPISGASVIIKGTGVGTLTDADGRYSFTAPPNSKNFIVRAEGYVQNEQAIENGLTIRLREMNVELGEVVTVAYGTRKKGDLTSSVTQVSAKDFQKGNIASAEQLLLGKVAGLQVTNGGGSAGGGSKIRIRGGASLNASNDPLIIIDGMPVDNNGVAGNGNVLNTINPNDIESISILKDAAATALYGSRASNGVIIVTTKSAGRGKVKFNFNTVNSIGTPTRKADVLSADEIKSIVNAEATKTGSNQFKNLLGSANTDWQSLIFANAMGTDNTLSASGLFKNIPIRASLGFLKQDGILRTNTFDRITASLNAAPKFFDNHLAVKLAVKYANTKNRFANEGAIGSAISFDPTQVTTGLPKFGNYFEWLNGTQLNNLATRNPLGLLYLTRNRSNVNRIISNIQLDYKVHFAPDFRVLFNAGIDNIEGSGNDNTDSTSASQFLNGGRYQQYGSKRYNYIINTGLAYAKNIPSAKSRVDVLLSHEFQYFKREGLNFATYRHNGTLIPGTTPVFNSDPRDNALESYLGRVNWTFNENYLFTLAARVDNSSKFAKENRSGFFPTAAFAWKLKNQFFKNNKDISDLRFRASWGITGQQDGIGEYGYIPVYSPSTPTAQIQFGNQFFTFNRPGAYVNDLRWEQTATTNLGLDFGFADNRLTGSFDIYRKNTKDLLSNVPVPLGSNFAINLTKNVGSMTTDGFELALNTVPVRSKNITWSLGGNLTGNRIKITKLLDYSDPGFLGVPTNGIAGGTGNNISLHAVGKAPHSFYTYRQVYNSNGKPIEGVYDDLNRDGVINDADRVLNKKPNPDFLVGVNTELTYKKFSIGLAGHGMIGNYVYNNYFSNNATLRNIQNPIGIISNVSRDYLETRFLNNQYLSDYYIENGSFFRLDNINLGYNFGSVIKKINNLRVGASIQNALLITKYRGLDPELSNNGVDNNIYPRPRVFSISASFDF